MAASNRVALPMRYACGSASVLPHHRTLIIRSAHATEAVTERRMELCCGLGSPLDTYIIRDLRLMSDAQDLPQARCNVTSMIRTTRSKAHGSLRRGVPTRRTVLRSEKSSLYIYERARRGS